MNTSAPDDTRSEPNPKEATVSDLLKYLKAFGRMNQDAALGNSDLGEALAILADLLKPYSDIALKDLGTAFPKRQAAPGRKVRDSQATTLPSDLKILNAMAIEELLKDHQLTKSQLIEIATQRFGISRSRLSRLDKNKVSDAVLSALNHEKALTIISQEAQRSGIHRGS